MSDASEIQPLDELSLSLVPTDIEVSTQDGLRIPFDQLPSMGAGMAAIAQAFAPAVSSAAAPVLFTVTDALGSPIPPAALQAFKDGSGLLGSFLDPVNGFGQARLHVANAAQASVVGVDPATIAIAAALMVVTQKLDSIQKTQEELFEYLKQRDKAELRGALQALASIAQDVRFSWDNQTFLQSAHAQVLEVRKQADAAIVLHRAQVRGKLKGGPLEIRAAVEARLGDLLDSLAECRLAAYVYALASFLEPLLSGSTSAEHLRSVSERITAHDVAYRELYTECYDAIEESSRSSIDAAVLGGLSSAGRALGDLIAKTPIGEHTLIDETIAGAGEDIGAYSEGVTDSLMAKLRGMKSPEVNQLREGVEALAALKEGPMRIAADSEALYLIPDGARGSAA